MSIQDHFKTASLIEKIGEDRISFEIYRVLVPDEDDPDFEQEYIVFYEPSTDRVVFTGAVVRSKEPVIVPDNTKTYLYEQLKKLVNELKKTVRSQKAKEKLDALLDLDKTFTLTFSGGRTYIVQNLPEREYILTTTSEKVKEIAERIFQIREILES